MPPDLESLSCLKKETGCKIPPEVLLMTEQHSCHLRFAFLVHTCSDTLVSLMKVYRRSVSHVDMKSSQLLRIMCVYCQGNVESSQQGFPSALISFIPKRTRALCN